MITPRSILFAALLLLGAFTLRVGATSRFVGLSSPPDRAAGGLDVVDYEGFAWSLVEGKGYALPDGRLTARRTPGTSFALVPPYVLFGRSYLAAHLWFCFLSAATCVAAASLAMLCVSPRYAALAGIGLALYPGHIYPSMHFFSEVPYALSVTLGTLFAVLSLVRQRISWGVLAGLSWGFATLCRPNIILVFPFLAVAAWMVPREQRRAAVVALVIQGIVIVSVVTPWVIRNYHVFGKPALATVVGGFTFWGANNSYVLENDKLRGSWYFGREIVDADHPLVGNEAEQERLAWQYGKEFIWTHWIEMPQLTAWKLYRLLTPFKPTPNRLVYWSFAIAWILIVPWFLVGLVHSFRVSPATALILQASWWATVAMTMVFYGSVRFRDGVSPLIMVISVSGVQAVWEYWTRRENARMQVEPVTLAKQQVNS